MDNEGKGVLTGFMYPTVAWRVAGQNLSVDESITSNGSPLSAASVVRGGERTGSEISVVPHLDAALFMEALP